MRFDTSCSINVSVPLYFWPSTQSPKLHECRSSAQVVVQVNNRPKSLLLVKEPLATSRRNNVACTTSALICSVRFPPFFLPLCLQWCSSAASRLLKTFNSIISFSQFPKLFLSEHCFKHNLRYFISSFSCCPVQSGHVPLFPQTPEKPLGEKGAGESCLLRKISLKRNLSLYTISVDSGFLNFPLCG